MKKILFFLSVFVFSIGCGLANATNITFLKSKLHNIDAPINEINMSTIESLITQKVNVSLYNQVKAQVIYNKDGQPDHILVFLIALHRHSFKILRININSNYGLLSSSTQNYQLTANDVAQRPGIPSSLSCPDTSIQFISVAPNDVTSSRNDQQYAIQADRAATANGLHTFLLLGKDATSANWLNYMSCPKLEGNFYDGDSDSSSVLTHDGYLTNKDFSTILKGKFRLKVTNIWLACQAYNDPMKSAVINDDQTQKYAAGISDLLCGPSDETAVCTMEGVLNGSKKISTTFSECYKQNDKPEDKWGLGGNGSDYFGQ